MSAPLVTKEQAIGLKELGFDVSVQSYHSISLKEFKILTLPRKDNWNAHSEWVSHPNIDEAARWLGEVKGVFISINAYHFDIGVLRWIGKALSLNDGRILTELPMSYEYNAALSAGITAAIEYLKNN